MAPPPMVVIEKATYADIIGDYGFGDDGQGGLFIFDEENHVGSSASLVYETVSNPPATFQRSFTQIAYSVADGTVGPPFILSGAASTGVILKTYWAKMNFEGVYVPPPLPPGPVVTPPKPSIMVGQKFRASIQKSANWTGLGYVWQRPAGRPFQSFSYTQDVSTLIDFVTPVPTENKLECYFSQPETVSVACQLQSSHPQVSHTLFKELNVVDPSIIAYQHFIGTDSPPPGTNRMWLLGALQQENTTHLAINYIKYGAVNQQGNVAGIFFSAQIVTDTNKYGEGGTFEFIPLYRKINWKWRNPNSNWEDWSENFAIPPSYPGGAPTDGVLDKQAPYLGATGGPFPVNGPNHREINDSPNLQILFKTGAEADVEFSMYLMFTPPPTTAGSSMAVALSRKNWNIRGKVSRPDTNSDWTYDLHSNTVVTSDDHPIQPRWAKKLAPNP